MERFVAEQIIKLDFTGLCYELGLWCYFVLFRKMSGRLEAKRSLRCSAKVRKAWSYVSIPLNAFMTRCPCTQVAYI